MADDRTGLLSSGRPAPPTSNASTPGSASSTSAGAVYYDSSQTPQSRMIQILFVALVVVMVLITMSLSIVQGVKKDQHGALYLLLGLSLLGFVAIEVLMIVFTRRGDLPKGKTWFLYVIGFCIILETIFTNVLLYE